MDFKPTGLSGLQQSSLTLGSVVQTVKPFVVRRRIPFRVMSWNVERLGDTGALGRNGGRRPDHVIQAIAAIIHKADPHLCVLLEVFNGVDGKGVAELERILKELRAKRDGWRCKLSPPTGGFDDDDGRAGQEGYALFYRADLGIEVPGGQWIQIYGSGNDSQETARGRSYYRYPWEFTVVLKGNGRLYREPGQDWRVKVAAYHAPGPEEAPQRQEAIKSSILALARHYQQANDPNVFICADFNANEAATNILGDPGNIEFDTSAPVDLHYLSRAYIVAKLAYLVNLWAAKYPNVRQVAQLQAEVESKQFAEMVYRYDGQYLEALETEVGNAYEAFATHDVKLKLVGSREATGLARKRMEPLVNEIVKVRAPQQQYQGEKEQYAKWRKLAGAKTKKAFETALKAVGEFDRLAAEDILAVYGERGMAEAQELAQEYFEDEYEDLHQIYRSRGYASFLKKMQKQAAQAWRNLVRELEHLEIEESYDGVFGAFHDAGFAVDTSYNSLQLTTRRKGVLNTSFVLPSGTGYAYQAQQSDDAVRYSTYDQVMPRVGEGLEEPTLRVVPVFKAVLGPFARATFTAPQPDTSGLFADLDFRALAPTPRKVDFGGMLVQVCNTASEKYLVLSKQELEKLKCKKLPYWKRRQFLEKVWEERNYYKTPHCCEKQCITMLDLNSVALIQNYLAGAKDVSDHDPVLLGVWVHQQTALTD